MVEIDDITLVRLAVFDIVNSKTDPTVANLSVHLDISSANTNHDAAIGMLKANIRKKIMSSETSTNVGRTASKAEIIISSQSLKGRSPVSYVGKIVNQAKHIQLDGPRSAKNLGDFRKECAKLAGQYIEDFEHATGILSFVQYRIATSRKKEETFIAILSAGYTEGVYQLDKESVFSYLDNTIQADSSTVILYPHIIIERLPVTDVISQLPSENGTVKYTAAIKVDPSAFKMHPLNPKNQDIYRFVGTKPPLNPQALTEKLYDDHRNEISKIDDLKRFDDKKVTGDSVVTIHVGEGKFKIPFNDLNKRIIPIITKRGKGILVKDQNLAFMLGDVDLFKEQKLRFLDLDNADEEAR